MVADERWRGACRDLAIGVCVAIDRGDFELAAAMFTEDAVFARGDDPLVGRAAILTWLRSRSADMTSRHLVTNFLPSRLSAAEAEATSTFALYRATGPGKPPLAFDGGAALIGEYSDRYRLTVAGWRIARREVSLILQR